MSRTFGTQADAEVSSHFSHAPRRRWLTAAPLFAFTVAAAHVAWEATHGGIQSHHLLNRADLPAISNVWGLLVLPVLGWLAAFLIGRRLPAARTPARVMAAFVGALAVGVALSTAFKLDLSDVAAGLFFAVLLGGLVLRTYRAEYLFGFVLGMMSVFGAVLPTLVACVAAGLSALAHRVVYPMIAGTVRRLRVAAR